jgi:hypothetical protein
MQDGRMWLDQDNALHRFFPFIECNVAIAETRTGSVAAIEDLVVKSKILLCHHRQREVALRVFSASAP